MFAPALPRVLASVALALLAVACSPFGSTPPTAGLHAAASPPRVSLFDTDDAIVVHVAWEEFDPGLANTTIGDEVQWYDVATGAFGSRPTDGDGQVLLPLSDLLVLSVKDARSGRVGRRFALVDTRELFATLRAGRRSVRLSRVREIVVHTGPDPRGRTVGHDLEVAVECPRFASSLLVDDGVLEGLDALFDAVLDQDDPTDTQRGDLDEVLALVRERPSLDAVRQLLPRERVRPRYRPDSEYRVWIAAGTASLLRVSAPIDGAFTRPDLGGPSNLDWSLFDDLREGRRWSESLVIDPRDGPSVGPHVLDLASPPERGVAVEVSVAAATADEPIAGELAVYAPQAKSALRPNWPYFVDAARIGEDGVVELAARSVGRRVLVWSQPSGDVFRHTLVPYDQSGAHAEVDLTAAVATNGPNGTVVLDVSSDCFDAVASRHAPVHEVLLDLLVQWDVDGDQQRLDLSLTAPGPGRHEVRGVPAGAQVSVRARARTTWSSTAPLVRLDVDGPRSGSIQGGGESEFRIEPNTQDRADAPMQRLVFRFPSHVAIGSRSRDGVEPLSIDSIEANGYATGYSDVHWASATEAYVDRVPGTWSRAWIRWTTREGASFVGHVLASEHDEDVVVVDLVRGRAGTGRVVTGEGRAVRVGRVEFGLWGPWPVDEIFVPEHTDGPFLDQLVRVDREGHLEFPALEPGATYVLAPIADGMNLLPETPRTTFTVPAGPSAQPFDLGDLELVVPERGEREEGEER